MKNEDNNIFLDPLTDIYTKVFFLEAGNKILQLASRNKVPLSLCIVDVDNLQVINEKYSHGIGNKILESITQTIQNNCRESDLIAYLGEGQMGLLLYNISGINTQTMLDGLRKKVEYSTYTLNQEKVHVTVSIGACIMHGQMNTKTLDAIYKQAYLAVNVAKENGKNRVSVY